MKITKKLSKTSFWIIMALAAITGLYFRLHGISFGLPHSTHADEPQIVELAVKYTYEIRSIIKENDYYRLIPINFVYGMFPTYLLTFATMLFSKVANFLNFGFEKYVIYIYLRVLTAISSMALIPITVFIYKKLFKKVSKFEIIFLAFLVTLNWKLVVHSHYVNMDIFLTILMNLSFLTLFAYLKNPRKSVFVILSGLIVGFAVGTKITAVLSLPWIVYLFVHKKDFRSLSAFLFLIYIGFAISNPFSLIFADDFTYRILEMQTKEAGLVFDSVNSDPFKYVKSLVFIGTPLIFLFSLYGNVTSFLRSPGKENSSTNKVLHVFLTGNILTYLVFYSLNSREVSRWLLPILPLILVYATKGMKEFLKTEDLSTKNAAEMKKTKKPKLAVLALFIILGTYLYYPTLLLKQYGDDTPKSAAYEWVRDSLPPKSMILAITEEGLDPFNKFQKAFVKRPIVYGSESAQFDMPPNPLRYDYVVLSSKPMKNYQRKEVQETYPFYSKRWREFEETVKNPDNFTLIKEFTLPKPNLVHLSDVYIYKKASQ